MGFSGIDIFDDDRCGQNILFFYNRWQPIYNELISLGVRFFNFLPTKDFVLAQTDAFSQDGGSIIIIDDFMQDISNDVGELFTVIAHHSNLTVFLLVQNLFPKNKHFRDISINATYIVIFKNPRDVSQISTFARQYNPGRGQFLMAVYKEATKEPYSHILFDNHQTTPDGLRIRSNILTDNNRPVSVWTTA
jgi:hypothetical protein